MTRDQGSVALFLTSHVYTVLVRAQSLASVGNTEEKAALFKMLESHCQSKSTNIELNGPGDLGLLLFLAETL